MIKVICLHPNNQKINITIINNENCYIYEECIRSNCKTEYNIFEDDVKNIIVEQDSLIRKWYWWIRLLNPLFFIQTAFFRRYDYIGTDGECTQIKFENNGKQSKGNNVIKIELREKYSPKVIKGMNRYFKFKVESKPHSFNINNEGIKLKNKYRLRWLLTRIIPSIVSIIFYYIVIFTQSGNRWDLSNIFVILLALPLIFIHNIILIFKTKSVDEELRG